jgi:hypothetical protein
MRGPFRKEKIGQIGPGFERSVADEEERVRPLPRLAGPDQHGAGIREERPVAQACLRRNMIDDPADRLRQPECCKRGSYIGNIASDHGMIAPRQKPRCLPHRRIEIRMGHQRSQAVRTAIRLKRAPSWLFLPSTCQLSYLI